MSNVDKLHGIYPWFSQLILKVCTLYIQFIEFDYEKFQKDNLMIQEILTAA